MNVLSLNLIWIPVTMIKTSTFFVILCGFVDLCFGQAAISFSETNFDFGEIVEGSVATHEFTFTNVGNQPLILSSVKASCGCTTPSWTKEPIMPGKSGHVTASYNSKNRPGGFHKSITVTTNADKPTQVLYIKGTAIKQEQKPLFTQKEIDNAPKAIISQAHMQLGKVPAGSSIPVEITIENHGKSSLEIHGILANCKCISVMPGKNLSIAPGSNGKLELVFSTRTVGEFTYGAYILSNDLIQPKYQIYVTSTVIPKQDKSTVVKEAPATISF